MKNIIVIILIIFFGCLFIFTSCNPLRPYKKREGCTELFAEVKAQWKYSDSTKLFYWDGAYSGTVASMTADTLFTQHASCTIGMSKKEVKKMLGEPSFFFFHRNEYFFYLNARCLRPGVPAFATKRSYYLVAKFGKDERLVKIFDRYTK